MRLNYLGRRVYYWLYIVMLSFRWIPRTGLGRKVLWHGQEWILIQGVCSPRWDLFRNGVRKDYIHERDFKLIQNPTEWIKAFRFAYNFYMRDWYGIWVNEGIKPWMRSCRIWGKDERPRP